MHLYLSSYLIGDRGHNLAHLARGKTALVVSNALDFSNDSERLRSGMEREIGRLADLGIPAETLDLRDYFAYQGILSEKLAAAGMLWVVGGNTFLLRKAMHLSGLDQLIHGKVDDEHFLYGGYSAGICVLSPSLRGIHLADEPEAQSNGYEHSTIWAGLGVIDYYIVLTTDVTTLNQKAWRLSWTTTVRMIFRIEQFRMAKSSLIQLTTGNKPSLLTPDPPPVQAAMTATNSSRSLSAAPGQA